MSVVPVPPMSPRTKACHDYFHNPDGLLSKAKKVLKPDPTTPVKIEELGRMLEAARNNPAWRHVLLTHLGLRMTFNQIAQQTGKLPLESITREQARAMIAEIEEAQAKKDAAAAAAAAAQAEKEAAAAAAAQTVSVKPTEPSVTPATEPQPALPVGYFAWALNGVCSGVTAAVSSVQASLSGSASWVQSYWTLSPEAQAAHLAELERIAAGDEKPSPEIQAAEAAQLKYIQSVDDKKKPRQLPRLELGAGEEVKTP